MEEKFDWDSLRLAYLAGVKVGIESFVKSLEMVVEDEINGKVLMEFIKSVEETTVGDVTKELMETDKGKGLLEVLSIKG